MPRHILTPEERLKGGKTARAKLAASGKAHKLTSADSRRGALAVHAYARTIGVHHGHQLTAEDRRRGGLATAAKRKAARLEALVTLALHKAPVMPEPPGPPCDCGANTESGEEHTMSCVRWAVTINNPTDARALGASLAGKLMEAQERFPPMTPERFYDQMREEPQPPPIDPFTLSALKRFLPGPRSPLSLTRSQRAHVDIMRREGYLMADGENMLALTEKGRQAVEGSES